MVMKYLDEKRSTSEPAGRSHSKDISAEEYESWRYNFVKERLRIFYLIGLVSNPIWIGLDYMHGSQFYSLFLIRALFNVALTCPHSLASWDVRFSST